MAKRSNSVTGLFGVINDESKVPPVIDECVDFLVDHASTKNLFFETGNETRMQNLRDEIIRGRTKEVPDEEDPHTIAHLFLQWFKVAKSPLIPSSLSLKLYAASLKSTTDLIKMFKEIVEFLTPARRGILKRTLRVLHMICLHGESSDKDGVIGKELSKLFRPFLLDLGDDEARNKVGEQVVLQAIINYKDLFKYRTASAPPRVIVRHDTEPTPPNPELEKAMAEGSSISPRRAKNFTADTVKYYLAHKYNEILTKGVPSPHPWWRNVPVFTPDSLKALVDSWKEKEEVAQLIEKAQKSPIIEEHTIEKEPGSFKAEKKLPDTALDWVKDEAVGDYDPDYFLKKQQEEEEQRKREQDERRKKADEEFERKKREKEEEERKKIEAKRIEEEKKKELRRIAKEQAEKIVEQEQIEKKKKHEEEWKKREEELARQREEYKKAHPEEDLNDEYEEVITVTKKVPKKSSNPTSPRDLTSTSDAGDAASKLSPRN